jgi:hypothetical protein
MNRPLEPVGNTNRPLLRMDTGIDVLEEWADGANQQDKNAVYAALFAMADRTLLRSHRVVDDGLQLDAFFVLLSGDLVLKMRMHCFDSFGIVYIGPHAGAPGLTSALGNDLAA